MIPTRGRPLSRHQIAELQGYSWPGDIRELQKLIQRAAIISCTGPLPFELLTPVIPWPRAGPGAPRRTSPSDAPASRDLLSYPELVELERANLLEVLRRTNWKVSGPGGAAVLLGVKPTTLASWIKAMEIRRPV